MIERGRYLLDTSVLIDISKNIEPSTTLVGGWLAESNEVGVCQVVVAEFFSGVPAPERQVWSRFLARLAFWIASPEVAARAGMYRHDYARLGTTLSITDVLIAAVAVSVGATLVTNNVRHFPMPELAIIQTRP